MTEPAKPTPPRKPRASTVRSARKTYADASLKQGRGFTPDKQAEYLAHLVEGVPRGMAAKLVAVNLKTINEYCVKDPAFKAAEVAAEAEATEAVEVALRNLALGGHLTAQMFYLQNRNPDRWKDMRQVAKTVKHEGTVTHALEAGPALERIAALQATLAERKELRAGNDPNVIDVEPVD